MRLTVRLLTAGSILAIPGAKGTATSSWRIWLTNSNQLIVLLRPLPRRSRKGFLLPPLDFGQGPSRCIATAPEAINANFLIQLVRLNLHRSALQPFGHGPKSRLTNSSGP